jgi:hypothetical protein
MENVPHLHYKDNMNVPRGKTVVPFNVKSGGTYSNHCALNAMLKVVLTQAMASECVRFNPVKTVLGQNL